MSKSPEEIGIVIKNIVAEMMERVMNKVLYEDPFLADKFRFEKPLYAMLVPSEIFKGSHFERRFVTPFGKIWEKLAKITAEAAFGFAVTGYEINGMVGEERLRRIMETLNRLEHSEKGLQRIKPNWEHELSYVLAGAGQPIPVKVICDVFVENTETKERLAFELKSPLPNSDITKVSKEKILKLFAMDPPQVSGAFFALPYNPYGKRELYEWGFPARWFDMKRDRVVVIGDEFWDMIGGQGTYQFFISQINEIGQEYRERIYREYLGMEPPEQQIPFL
jgi:hypothetical protein